MSDHDIGVHIQTHSERVVSSPMETKFPGLTEKLLSVLEELYPNECPALNLSEREIWYRAGQHAVVQRLRAEYETQVAEARN